ncbi:TonB-dependent receptor [Pseudorhodoferax sp.]|uniref:TonB-dependent receptor n=1 Tax=Pseudorhodoferax sp. TaxID=1993553 RepID=UPI0039E6A541
MPHFFPGPQRAVASAAMCLFAAGAHAQAEPPAAGDPAARPLPTVTVQDTAPTGVQTKELPSYKFTAPLRDTPRSITVIPREVLKEKNASTFEEALRTVPGVTFLGGDAAANPAADRPVLRGFESRNSIFVDGMRDSGVQSRETFAIDSISVIKGPDSVYGGRGSVGGSIDIVTKTPRLENFTNASLGLGTANYRRGTVDLNRQVGETTAVRLNAMAHDADQPGRSDVYSKRWGIAPSVAFGLNTPTTVTLGYYHLNTRDMPDFSVPFRSTGGAPAWTNRKRFYGLDARDHRHTQNDSGEIRVEHRLDGGWKIRNTTMLGRATLDYIATNPQFTSATSNVLGLQAKSGKYATNSIANQTELTGRLELAGLRHTITTGLEFSAERSLYEGYLVADAMGNNIRSGGPCAVAYNCVPLDGAWDPGSPWTGTTVLNGDRGFPGPATRTRTRMASAYLFDSIDLSEHWILSAGLRLDHFSVKSSQAGVAELGNSANLANYQVGLVYKPVKPVSLYASYGTSANPPGSNAGLGGGSDQITATNQNLKPEKSRNIEVGAKWDVLDERLSLNAALFQTEKTNARVSDGLGGTVNAGAQRVRGLELGVAGRAAPDWNLFGGYSYLNGVTTDAGPASPSLSGLPLVMVPRHNLTLWSSYKVLPRLTLGGGVTASSLTYASVAATTRRWIPGYARVDLSATWRIDDGMDLQFNLNNAFDRKYFQSAYPIYASWAPGRSAMVTLNIYR